MSTGKRTKLSFKGDKTKKPDDEEDEIKRRMMIPKDGWSKVQKIDDLLGPIYIEHLYNNKLYNFKIMEDEHIAIEENQFFTDFEHSEPYQAHQVLVAVKVSGVSHYYFQTMYGTYLSSSKDGELNATSKAMGMQEQFYPEIQNGNLVLKDIRGKYLQINIEFEPKFIDQIEDATKFLVKYQNLTKHLIQKRVIHLDEKSTRATDEIYAIDVKQLELDMVKKYQTWGRNKHHVTNKSHEDVKEAKKTGRLAESLLDRRAKIKADRYCK